MNSTLENVLLPVIVSLLVVNVVMIGAVLIHVVHLHRAGIGVPEWVLGTVVMLLLSSSALFAYIGGSLLTGMIDLRKCTWIVASAAISHVGSLAVIATISKDPIILMGIIPPIVTATVVTALSRYTLNR